MNADPRRPDKIQRYVPTKNTANGEDLTPDYMNIMGQPPTTANAAGEAVDKHQETSVVEPIHQARPDDVQPDELTVTTNAANVIPTSPQYGVAIIPNNVNVTTNDMTSESATMPTDTLAEASSVKTGDDNKDIHSTPSRNDRFKVVKIASLEPFKRGRWKCMDYVDEAPPPNVVNVTATKTPQSVGNTGVAGGVYLQTQSLPQQQIQQMLLQGGFTNGQFFPNVPAQLIPQGQYFYPQVANVQSQTIPQPVTSLPTQFINNQPYFAGMVPNPAGFTLPQGYPNIQYVPIPTQNSAFVSTTQAVHLPGNFQQSQSYAGQPSSSQGNMNQNMVNGHAYPPHSDSQVQGSSMPAQQVKNVIVNSQPVSTQPQQNHVVQNQTQSAPVVQQYQQTQSGTFQQPPTQQPQSQSNNNQNMAPIAATSTVIAPVIGVPQQPQQNFDASNVYTNPQFTMSVTSLTVLDSVENNQQLKETNSAVETVSENSEDPNKSNPVVNAIDNKIEQAMDLVKSHLMYTVREEVEVLKEKIAELMEKIQQLETENNYLRSQIPKTQGVAPPASSTFSQQMSQVQPQNIAVVNPSPSVMPQNSNHIVNNASQQNQSPAIPNNNNIHQSNPRDPTGSIQ